MSELLKFTCPECGGGGLELLSIDCMVQTPMKLYDDGGPPEYGDDEVITDGEFDCIRCRNCGAEVMDGKHNITEDEIHDWVREIYV
jgi:hypothetical protein